MAVAVNVPAGSSGGGGIDPSTGRTVIPSVLLTDSSGALFVGRDNGTSFTYFNLNTQSIYTPVGTIMAPGSNGGSGGMNRLVQTVSGNTTAGSTANTDYVYFVTATCTITLPTAVSNTNRYTFVVFNTGVTLTIAAASGQTIDGNATQTYSTEYQSVDILSNNANWGLFYPPASSNSVTSVSANYVLSAADNGNTLATVTTLTPDSQSQNVKFYPCISINTGIGADLKVEIDGEFWFTGSATVIDDRVWSSGNYCTLKSTGTDTYVLTGTKGYLPSNAVDTGVKYCGCSLSGMEFGTAIPGTAGTDYFVINQPQIDFWYARGCNLLRIPFLWGRLQPTLNGTLNTAYLGYLTSVVQWAAARNITVVLDSHDYGFWSAVSLGSPNSSSQYSVTNNQACDTTYWPQYWGLIATAFASYSNVVFSLCNEPSNSYPSVNTSSSGVYNATGYFPNAALNGTAYASDQTFWAGVMNSAIAAIRAAGATQPIIVQFGSGDSSDSFSKNGTGYLLPGLMTDSLNNLIYEVHKYLDNGASGTNQRPYSTTQGIQTFQQIVGMAQEQNIKLFYGEFGSGPYATSLAAMSNMLAYLNAHADVVWGWAVWGGGQGWNSSSANYWQTSLSGGTASPANIGETGQSTRQRNYFPGGSRRDGKINSIVVSASIAPTSTITLGTVGEGIGATAGSWYAGAGGSFSPINKPSPFTLEAGIIVPTSYAPSASTVVMGASGIVTLGLTTAGIPTVQMGGGYTITGSTAIKDGAVHTLRLVYSRLTGFALLVDGLLVASSMVTGNTANVPQLTPLGISAVSSSTANSATAAGVQILWAKAWNKSLGKGNYQPDINKPLPNTPYSFGTWLFQNDANQYIIGDYADALG